MHGPELCAGSIVYSEEKILLIRRGTEPEKGLWSLPGGRVQKGESIRHAALRELKEESNLEGQFEEMMGKPVLGVVSLENPISKNSKVLKNLLF